MPHLLTAPVIIAALFGLFLGYVLLADAARARRDRAARVDSAGDAGSTSIREPRRVSDAVARSQANLDARHGVTGDRQRR